MNIFLLLPILIPLATAIVALALRRYPRAQQWTNVVGAGALLAAGAGLLATVIQSGVQVGQLGNWAAPFGISLVADLFSAIMVGVAGLVGVTVAVYSLATTSPAEQKFGYYPLVHLLLMAVNGAFLTGDIFNLYVWYELMLIASFVLLVIEGRRAQLAGAIKYVSLNLVASVLFLIAVGMLYGLAGTLNMADLAGRVTLLPAGLVTTLAMLFLVAFGIKAAAFPLFFWLPASYHTASAVIIALFAGLLTKVGVYSLVRVFTLIFTQDVSYTHGLILVVAGVTMVTGVLGAVAQMEFRKLLSFHIVSQIGYLLMGLGLYSQLALAGVVFFMVHVILAKSALFLVGGLIYHLRGTYQLKKLGGLYAASPGLALLFLVPALSLAGLPPFSGFWAKLTLVKAGLDGEAYLIVGTALLVSILTLFSMTKIWAEVFWKDNPQEKSDEPAPLSSRAWLALTAPVAAMSIILIFLGVAAEPLINLSLLAAEQLLNPANYIDTVLGGVS